MDRQVKDSIFQHVDNLNRLLGDWEQYAKQFSLKDITKDRESFHLTCHAMFRSIQEALDIAGELTLVCEIHPRPDTYKSTMEILSSKKKWPKNLHAALVDLAKFRNVLVHQYSKLNLQKVHDHLINGHKHLRKFQKMVLKDLLS